MLLMAQRTTSDMAAEAVLGGGGKAAPERRRWHLGWREELTVAWRGVLLVSAIVLSSKLLIWGFGLMAAWRAAH
jgi:hypothetical protein